MIDAFRTRTKASQVEAFNFSNFHRYDNDDYYRYYYVHYYSFQRLRELRFLTLNVCQQYLETNESINTDYQISMVTIYHKNNNDLACDSSHKVHKVHTGEVKLVKVYQKRKNATINSSN